MSDIIDLTFILFCLRLKILVVFFYYLCRTSSNIMRLKKTILYVIICLLALLSLSCKVSPQVKAERKAEKMAEKAEKQALKDYEQAKKQHYKSQPKATRKMMKQAKKRANRLNRYKKHQVY